MTGVKKIALVARKFSFKEAEEADDKYWSKKSAEYRLRALMDLRKVIYGNQNYKAIEKVVYKRHIDEEAGSINKLKSRNKN